MNRGRDSSKAHVVLIRIRILNAGIERVDADAAIGIAFDEHFNRQEFLIGISSEKTIFLSGFDIGNGESIITLNDALTDFSKSGLSWCGCICGLRNGGGLGLGGWGLSNGRRGWGGTNDGSGRGFGIDGVGDGGGYSADET